MLIIKQKNDIHYIAWYVSLTNVQGAHKNALDKNFSEMSFFNAKIFRHNLQSRCALILQILLNSIS